MPPDALELALLQRAQQLHLHLDRDLADLVEEERPAVGELEAPRLAGHGARERAALVAEELALDELLRDGRAVDLDERLVLAARVLVQRAGDELLARPALARDEHRGRRVGHSLEDRVELRDAVRRADDAEARARGRGGRVGAAQLARLQRLGDDLAHLVLVEGLGDEVERAALERLDGGVDRAVRGDEDDGKLGLDLERALEERHAVDLRHLEIGDDEVDVVLAEEMQTLLAVLGGQDVVAVARELRGEDLPQVRLVVDDEDLLALREHGAGQLTNNVGSPMHRRYASIPRHVNRGQPIAEELLEGDHGLGKPLDSLLELVASPSRPPRASCGKSPRPSGCARCSWPAPSPGRAFAAGRPAPFDSSSR